MDKQHIKCQLCKAEVPFLMTVRYDHKVYVPGIKSLIKCEPNINEASDSLCISKEADGKRVCVRCLNALQGGIIGKLLWGKGLAVRCTNCGTLQLDKTWCKCDFNLHFKKTRRRLKEERQRHLDRENKKIKAKEPSDIPGEW